MPWYSLTLTLKPFHTLLKLLWPSIVVTGNPLWPFGLKIGYPRVSVLSCWGLISVTHIVDLLSYFTLFHNKLCLLNINTRRSLTYAAIFTYTNGRRQKKIHRIIHYNRITMELQYKQTKSVSYIHFKCIIFVSFQLYTVVTYRRMRIVKLCAKSDSAVTIRRRRRSPLYKMPAEKLALWYDDIGF